MKITARINREDQKLVQTLNERGIKARLVKNGVIVELPAIREPADGFDGEYQIPKEVDGVMLFIDISEHGGGMTKTGSAIIVCGLTGKALRPYYVPQHGTLVLGIHAHFAVSTAVVTITGYRNEDNVTIREHRIVHERKIARIKTTELWHGRWQELPQSFSKFYAAAKVANEKGNCYHCRHVHFAREK
jgi:hypothetical protein